MEVSSGHIKGAVSCMGRDLVPWMARWYHSFKIDHVYCVLLIGRTLLALLPIPRSGVCEWGWDYLHNAAATVHRMNHTRPFGVAAVHGGFRAGSRRPRHFTCRMWDSTQAWVRMPTDVHERWKVPLKYLFCALCIYTCTCSRGQRKVPVPCPLHGRAMAITVLCTFLYHVHLCTVPFTSTFYILRCNSSAPLPCAVLSSCPCHRYHLILVL